MFGAFSPCLIHHFLHLKMPVPNQKLCVLLFDFAICLRTFRLEIFLGVQYFCDFTFCLVETDASFIMLPKDTGYFTLYLIIIFLIYGFDEHYLYCTLRKCK